MSEPIFDVVKEMCSSPITISSSYKVKDYNVKLVHCSINYRNKYFDVKLLHWAISYRNI